jgi:hypothetical protein
LGNCDFYNEAEPQKQTSKCTDENLHEVHQRNVEWIKWLNYKQDCHFLHQPLKMKLVNIHGTFCEGSSEKSLQVVEITAAKNRKVRERCWRPEILLAASCQVFLLAGDPPFSSRARRGE